MIVTAELLRKHRACYSDELLADLFPHPRSLKEVLTLQEGVWGKSVIYASSVGGRASSWESVTQEDCLRVYYLVF